MFSLGHPFSSTPQHKCSVSVDIIEKRNSQSSSSSSRLSMAQQRSHVPKFGNWEGDNVPITAYFDSAIKQKIGGGGGVIMNPNDPAQNPEAFKFGRSAINIENSTDTEELSQHSNKISGPTSPASSEQYQADVEGHRWPFAHRKKPNTSESDQTNNSTPLSTQKSNVSDLSSVFSVQHEEFDRQKITSENKFNSFLATPNRSNRSKAAINPADDYDISFTSLSVPKFGAWDEKHLQSGEGFSVIFKKVKEEKQTATVKFPPVQPQTINTPANESKKSKRYCCC